MEDELYSVIARSQRAIVEPGRRIACSMSAGEDDDGQGALNLWQVSPHVLEAQREQREGKRTDSPAHTRARIYDLIKSARRKGRTDEELQIVLALDPRVQKAHRAALATGGAVFDSGRRRRTKAGGSAIVWIAARYVEGAAPVDESNPGGAL